ncbi:MAG: isoprenylcysteine carboxylmethyltransferase family protein [Saprospiraceae bacterium]|nr:isoprenylcysteine carboxylmethyltransferase family protein [Saprospiraceae bacterium]
MTLPGHRLLVALTTVGMILLLASNLILIWPIHAGTEQWSDISLAILFPAMLLLFWALVTLGWAMFQIFPGDQLVARGPYRYIRHPFTFGMIIGVTGIALATNNWLSLLSVVFILWPVLTLRAMREEKDLQEKFGTEWTLYQSSTQFLIPWVW